MWSELTVADTARIEKYLTCYQRNNGPAGNVAQLRSQIHSSGYSFYLYEGQDFELILCLGYVERARRYTVIDASYSGQIVPNTVVPLVVDKLREYTAGHGTDTLYAVMADKISAEGAQMLALLAASPGVTLTQQPAPPQYIELTLTLGPTS